MEILEQGKRKTEPRLSHVAQDEFTEFSSRAFDYEFDGFSMFYGWEKPTKLPEDFNIGVIVGSSGSGKSNLLKEFGEEEVVIWQATKAIVSHFPDPETAATLLTAVGLNSIPSWTRPHYVLSTGEKFRADLARKLKDNAVIDEFTSVVNRQVAKSASSAVSHYIKENGIKGVVFATCHDDILAWLEPDWVFDADSGTLYDGRSLRRPEIKIEILPCHRSAWGMFSHHHYLTNSILASARCFIAVWEGEVVGFASSITMPNGAIKNAWREHRTVVLPDYQGIGIGAKLSDAIAQLHIDEGKRYYSRTAHPRLGNHRDYSTKWKKTSKYKKLRTDIKDDRKTYNNHFADNKRVCFSHEYIGDGA